MNVHIYKILSVVIGLSPFFAQAQQSGDGETLHEYAQMCTDLIGEIPAFDCLDGDIVPITVNGEQTKL